MDKDEVLNRWSEYIEELFYDERGEKPLIKKNIEGPEIMKAEVKHALNRMKHGKATGPDNIPAEAIESLEDLGIDMVTKLLNAIYDTGAIPTEMSKSVFIALPKKTGATECELHRTISLMSHMTKILLRILMQRMKNKVRPEIANAQYGFMEDRGTRNAISTLNRLIERSVEVQKDIFLCFIDYSKAFDKVKHEELFNILQSLDIDGKDLRVIRNLYWEQTAAMRVDGDISEYKSIRRGVRQGCILSPDLFNIYSEMVLREIGDLEGIKVGGVNINNLRYADDTVLLADSQDKLQAILDKVVTASEEKGLSLNVKKTECMVASKKKTAPRCILHSKGEKIKEVSSFNYLGSTITTNGKSEAEIKRRITMAKNSFMKLSPVFKNRNIRQTTKLRILQAYVWSILQYGCESWTLKRSLERRIEAAEMWLLRKMMRIPWTVKMTNVQVLRLANTKRYLLRNIRKRQLQFVGHICRKRDLEHLALTGKLEGKKSRGRQRETFITSLNRWTNGEDSSNANFLSRTHDRKACNVIIANAWNRHGT